MHVLRIFDVEHGQCALIELDNGAFFMIDVGHNSSTDWMPGSYLAGRNIHQLDILAVTNFDHDHVSGLNELLDQITVRNLMWNRGVTTSQLRGIKALSGGMSPSISRLVNVIDTDFVGPVVGSPGYPDPLTCQGFAYRNFRHAFPTFTDTNNLSLVVYAELYGVGVLFPGDLERDGWLEMLERPEFRDVLRRTQIFVASHHGRDSGICPEVFNYRGEPLCQPRLVVISDKGYAYETQETLGFYGRQALGANFGVPSGTRYVVTTRRDGRLLFRFGPSGWYANA